MLDIAQTQLPEIVPARKQIARLAGLFAACGESFETLPVGFIDPDFAGIPDDIHSGLTRRSGGREPWYPRGTEIRNDRQLSIVAPDELDVIAARMGIARVQPEWIGANLLIDGLPHLSMLPSGTLLFFAGGVTIKINGQNAPCRQAGRILAQRAGMTDRQGGALLFAKVAKRLRGLVGWIEKPSRLTVGEEISVRVPEQWIYRT